MNEIERTVRVTLGAHSGSCLDNSDEVEPLVSDLVEVLESKRQRTLREWERKIVSRLLHAECDVLETAMSEARSSQMVNWERAIKADRDRVLELANAIGGGSF